MTELGVLAVVLVAAAAAVGLVLGLFLNLGAPLVAGPFKLIAAVCGATPFGVGLSIALSGVIVVAAVAVALPLALPAGLAGGVLALRAKSPTARSAR